MSEEFSCKIIDLYYDINKKYSNRKYNQKQIASKLGMSKNDVYMVLRENYHYGTEKKVKSPVFFAIDFPFLAKYVR